jgi:hypothetical protein
MTPALAYSSATEALRQMRDNRGRPGDQTSLHLQQAQSTIARCTATPKGRLRASLIAARIRSQSSSSNARRMSNSTHKSYFQHRSRVTATASAAELTISMRLRTVYFRSSSQLSPADLFGQLLQQSLTTVIFWTTAALPGLKPASARGLRGAHPHHLLQH